MTNAELTKRILAIEQKLNGQSLMTGQPVPLEEVVGIFRGDPDFPKMVKAGRKWRQSVTDQPTKSTGRPRNG